MPSLYYVLLHSGATECSHKEVINHLDTLLAELILACDIDEDKLPGCVSDVVVIIWSIFPIYVSIIMSFIHVD